MGGSDIVSFEVSKGGPSGDLLSAKRGSVAARIGFIGAGFFEYWRMYAGLKERVERSMKQLADLLEGLGELYDPGLIDTIDKADAAGRLFADAKVTIVVVAEGTYCPDYFVHQALLHLPESVAVLLVASQEKDGLDFSAGYEESLANSGPMGIIQLACSFRKMDKYRAYHPVIGAVNDPALHAEITRFVRVRKTIEELRFWNIGLIGHIFRGMYDFQYDKTSVSGTFGPHIMDIDLKHLSGILAEVDGDGDEVREIAARVRIQYVVEDISEAELLRAARLGVAFGILVERYKLDGIALLGQHFIEVEAKTTCYLGLAELLRSGKAQAVTEGDVLGLIMSKVMGDISGVTPFFGEWEEIDSGLNAILLLGHGFIDPRMARKDRPLFLKPACEEWGFEGKAPGIEATYVPGPVTVSHVIRHNSGWKMLVSEGEILDCPPLCISESSIIFKVKRPVKEYFAELIRLGFSHHAIACPGHIGDSLKLFAAQIGVEVCEL